MELQKHDVQALNSAQISIITQKTPEHLIEYRKGKGGKKFAYCPHTYVTKILNDAFSHNWSFYVSDPIPALNFTWEEEYQDYNRNKVHVKHIEVGVKGKLVVHTPGGDITKEQYGSDELLIKNGKPNKTLSDVAKGAGSDALRKCASELGIALDLYGKGLPEEPGDQKPLSQGEWNRRAKDLQKTAQQVQKRAKQQPPEESEEKKQIDRMIARIQEEIKKVRRRQIRISNKKSAFVYLNKKLWAVKDNWQKLLELEAEIARLLEEWEREAAA